jgi:metal-responsive CopG/Arc/MetJ family transcriptional regulator
MEKTQINVRNVPADLLKRAQEIAKQQDRPLSQVIRDLMREWVAENEQKLPDPQK